MKNNKEEFKYNVEFLEFAFSYLNNYELLEIDINEINNFSKKEKEVLNRIKDIYSKVRLLKDYEIVELEHFSNEEVLELANNFLIELFPKRKKEILNLDNLIEFSDCGIYGAGVNYRLSKNGIEYGKIMIPEEGSIYTSSIIVHEKTHVLAFESLGTTNLFINNLELFPMLTQRMMLNNTNDYYATILDRIVRTSDTKSNFSHLEFMNYLKTKQDKTILDECVYNYFKVRSYEYLTSELYSDLLNKYYLMDKEKMVKRINQVFDKKISISDFLNSYNVNLLNKDLIPIIKEETNKCKRISIIP